MLRSMFFSIGLFVGLWGVSLLFVDQVVLNVKPGSEREAGFRGFLARTSGQDQKVVNPPDWAAFSLMSVGSVTMLYAVALPKKKPGA